MTTTSTYAGSNGPSLVDFHKLLCSFKELMLEVVSWLVFVPRTLWLLLRHPLRMVAYARHEQQDQVGKRHPDAMSPPLLLILSAALAHGLEVASGETVPTDTTLGRILLGSDRNLILTRSLLFALLPLLAAVRYVKAQDLPVERPHLRAQFVEQCNLAAVYALGIALVEILFRGTAPWGQAAADILLLAATTWYRRAQTGLLRQPAKFFF